MARMKELEIGKLPPHILKEAVIDKLDSQREEVLFSSSIGGDTAVLDMGEDLVVLSSDPITGSASNIGRLAVHISVNDVATQGAEVVGILLTLLLPPKTREEEVIRIMEEAQEESSRLNIDIIGGHTEVTGAVNKILAVSTVVGRVDPDHRPRPETIGPGDILAVSKYLGLEGTAILAHDRAEDLASLLTPDELTQAQGLVDSVSVYTEGLLARDLDLGYMHDITEGGILGAAWEASQAIGRGVIIQEEALPILDVTHKVCDHFKISPLKLISSGSMLIILKEEDLAQAQALLEKEGIGLSPIGFVSQEEGAFIKSDQGLIELEDAPTDDLYRAL